MHCDYLRGGHSLGGKQFKDFSRTFNSIFEAYSVDVLPSYAVFSDGNFREYAMFIASYKTTDSIKFVYWILDLTQFLTCANNDFEVLKFEDFQGPFTSSSKTFKDLFCFQGLF